MKSANCLKLVFGLFGAGGYAREVMPLVEEAISIATQDTTKSSIQIFFVEKDRGADEINDYPVISEAEFFKIECNRRYFNISIADSKKREHIATDCIAKGAIPMSIKSLHSIAYDRNEIGEGAIISANTVITSNVKIGKFFQLNIYSYVAHDCIIGDYVTFAPNVQCNGNVHIHNHAYIGTGAILRDGTLLKPLVIGEGAVVGMGAVVTKDVPPHTTVVGNPAKPL
jgi:sugar O-acyltransferase (sialic acid O-acetyltransferase NeuD family)